MLPFSTYEFLIFLAMYISIIYIAKLFVKDAQYKYVLGVLNLIYLTVIYPQPYHFLMLIGFSYLTTYLISEKLKFNKKIFGILLLLLPMVLVKLNIKVHYYPYVLNNILSFAGLSYASFRIMGYYMDKGPNDKMANPVSYFNFIAFTPTLLIGPIEKYSRYIASEVKGFSNITSENFIIGWNALVKGIAFKYVLAEVVDRYWLKAEPYTTISSFNFMSGMYAYYFYLFFDFAGYSFMALGIGKMMGINVPVNFTNPFVAQNPQDFWKRFHISLGDWLKDYFFTPLYMFFTRKKSLKQYPIIRQNISLTLTFLLMGCWNGFQKHYVVSGLLFGLYSAVHNTYVMQCRKQNRDIVFGKLNETFVKYISIIITFNLVAFSLYIFSGKLF